MNRLDQRVIEGEEQEKKTYKYRKRRQKNNTRRTKADRIGGEKNVKEVSKKENGRSVQRPP